MKCTETETTTVRCTRGSTRSQRNSYFSNSGPIAKNRGQVCGTFPVPDTYQLAIPPSYPLGYFQVLYFVFFRSSATSDVQISGFWRGVCFVIRRRELEEEIGISLPDDAFELIFVFKEEGFVKLELINTNVYFKFFIVCFKLSRCLSD